MNVQTNGVPSETLASVGGFDALYPVARTAKGDILRPLKIPLYDTESIPASAVATRTFFQRPQGSADQSGAIASKTAGETNLTQQGQITVPNQFKIFGFLFETQPGTTLADFRLIYITGLFQFLFTGNRVYLEVPIQRVPCGVAPEGFTALDGNTGAVERTEVHQGRGLVSNYYAFDYRRATLHIQSAENFTAKLEYPLASISIAAATRVRVYLLGVLFTAI